MNRGRLVAFGLGLGLVAAQAGHLLAYQLRYGAAAPKMQSTGAHLYFPVLLKSGLGLAAGFLVLTLVIVGFARLVAGRRIAGAAAPSLLRLFALLFSVQLACYFAQETIEAAAGGPASSPVLLVLWGAVGQLPLAFLAALALRWFAVRIGPAVATLRMRPRRAIRLVAEPVLLVAWPAVADVGAPVAGVRQTHTRRGPPV